ncbi:MAG TPA: hypothetical protein VHB20_13005 [Verrucomicrobiae bacterium]|jgi:hypothetical protein|nr:hypothetical protein [Verrucomicrobiae bacterium]
MTKFLLGVVIVVGLALGGWQIFEYWGKVKAANPDPNAQVVEAPPPAPSDGDSLTGMPENLEPIYQASKARGVAGLRDFLTIYGKSMSDPRLSWIQLDYVLLVAQSNPAEARRVFALVKNRTTSDSPVYRRVQLLAKTYE